AVTGLGRDDVHGGNEVFVSKGRAVEIRFGHYVNARARRRGRIAFTLGQNDAVRTQAIERVRIEALQTVAAERREHERNVRRQSKTLADFGARTLRAPRDERDIDDRLERRKSPMHWQTPCCPCARIRGSDELYEILRMPGGSVSFVNPIPGEIGD